MIAHTKGPWVASKGSLNAAVNGAWGDIEECADGGVGFSVATIWADVEELEPHADANAYLIAAAPDLLVALQALRIDANRLCDRQLGGSYEDDCRLAIKNADAAITKAIGR